MAVWPCTWWSTRLVQVQVFVSLQLTACKHTLNTWVYERMETNQQCQTHNSVDTWISKFTEIMETYAFLLSQSAQGEIFLGWPSTSYKSWGKEMHSSEQDPRVSPINRNSMLQSDCNAVKEQVYLFAELAYIAVLPKAVLERYQINQQDWLLHSCTTWWIQVLVDHKHDKAIVPNNFFHSCFRTSQPPLDEMLWWSCCPSNLLCSEHEVLDCITWSLQIDRTRWNFG